MPQKLKVGKDDLEIVDRFCYLGNVILCGGGLELALRNRIYLVLGVNGGNWRAC